jgi:drug/metabolite transporter (DMT)-like permease
MNIGQQLFSAGIFSFVIAFVRKEWGNFSIASVPVASWLGLFFLIFFGSLVGYLSYIWLLSVKPAALVSTHTYINPIVAVLAGWIITSQIIDTSQLVGLFVILFGVLLTNCTKYFRLSDRSKVKIRRTTRVLIRKLQ